MNLKQAFEIRHYYGVALANNSSYFRSEQYLRNTKEQIIAAFKVWMIYLMYQKSISDEEIDQEILPLGFFGVFLSHDDYLKLKEHKNPPRDFEAHSFFYDKVLRIIDSSSSKLLEDFAISLRSLNSLDPNYFLKAYALADIPYYPQYKQTFEDTSWMLEMTISHEFEKSSTLNNSNLSAQNPSHEPAFINASPKKTVFIVLAVLAAATLLILLVSYMRSLGP